MAQLALDIGTAQAEGMATEAPAEATTTRLAVLVTVVVTAATATTTAVPEAAEAMAVGAAVEPMLARVDGEAVAEVAAQAPPVPRTPFLRMAAIRLQRAAMDP